jgi:YD repeat-containing protein
MKKYIYITGLLACNFYMSQSAADTYQKIVPQAPEVNSLLKNFENPVSLNSGNPDISVPIYTIKSSDIVYDVRLSYNYSGIAVNEKSPWVGLGWSLSTPSLVRTVRQLPDDSPGGFFYETQYTVPIATELMRKVEQGILPVSATYDLDSRYRNGALDLESDDYKVFLPDGQTLSFMVNQERSSENPVGQFVQFPDSDYKINYNTTLGKWTITSPTGLQYIYKVGNTLNFSHTYTHGGTSIGTEPTGQQGTYAQTWILEKIISPENSELNFEYEEGVFYDTCELAGQSKTVDSYDSNDPRGTVYTSFSRTKGYNYQIKRIYGAFGEVKFNKSDRLDDITNKKLESVDIHDSYGRNIDKISFQYDYITSFPPSTPVYSCNHMEDNNNITKRLLLKKIWFGDISLHNSYQFNYNSQLLPHRFSYARDWWGYYNGKTTNLGLTPSIDVVFEEENDRNVNLDFAKAGQLEEIILPTGGKTKFYSESNKGIFFEQDTKRTYKIHDIIPYAVAYKYFSTSENPTQQTNKTYNIPLNIDFNKLTNQNSIKFELNTNTTKCIYPDLTLPTNGSCSIYYKILNSNNVELVSQKLFTNTTKVIEIPYNQLTTTNTIQVQVYAGNPNTPNSQLFDYNADEATVNINWKEIDPNLARNTAYGVEVPFGGLRVKRIENYNENSALVLARDYDYKNENGVESGISNFELDFLQQIPGKNFVNSQSRFPLQTGSGRMISYTAAKEDKVNISSNQKITINSVFENKTILGDYLGSCFYNNMEGNFLRASSTLPCFDYPKNGKIRFNNLGDRQEESYEYYVTDENTIKPKVVYGIDYDLIFKPKNILDLIAYGTGYPFETYYYKFQNFDENGDFIKTTTEHLGSQDIVSTVKTFTSSINHHQLMKQTTISPDGTINATSYSYAHDKGNQLMISKNMIGIPLETTATQTTGGVTKTLGKTETVYPTSLPTPQAGNLVLPLYQKSYDKLDNTPSTDITYDKYDDKGNVLQYTTKDGIPVTIIWGYNKTQPITKIEGISYDILSDAVSISGIVTASDNDALDPTKEGLLLDALNSFRKESVLLGKKITTYTYDPLIGVTSITPPSGVRQTYQYDAANRLKEGNVRGKNSSGTYINKKVSENNYNYKP